MSLMVRRRSCAVSNHEPGVLILRDATEWPLLRMRGAFSPAFVIAEGSLNDPQIVP